VAERRHKAEREMAKLAKKGRAIKPVKIEGRTIARTFWGKAWCDNLESYLDYENRLPRGRTYVRNGSVVHLDIRHCQIRWSRGEVMLEVGMATLVKSNCLRGGVVVLWCTSFWRLRRQRGANQFHVVADENVAVCVSWRSPGTFPVSKR
jgi:hypothetical protein